MNKPELDIDVDPQTGRWFVDGIPMILVPQHFFMNNHFAMEEALGAEGLSNVLAPAGRTSAYVWCKKQSEIYGLTGEAVFAHYMKRLSQRGWGLFSVQSIDSSKGTATVRLDHSSIISGAHAKSGRRLCYMFAPWMKGAMEYVCDSTGQPMTLSASEIRCAAEGHEHCLFQVAPHA